MNYKHKTNWRFCSKCGKEMKYRFVDKHYDTQTGRKRFNVIWTCPDKKWWNWHNVYKSDQDGSTYAFEV